MTHRLPIAILTLLLPTVLLAQTEEPLIGDRPDFTESAATVSPGRVQFEAGFTRITADESSLSTLGEVLVRVGVEKNTEVRLTLGSYAWLKEPPFVNNDGLTDLAIGAKHRFVKNDGLVPETALLFTLTLPTGARGVSFEQVQPIFIGAFGWELSRVFSLGANAGWSHAYAPSDDNRFSTWWGSVSLAAALGGRWGAFLEAFGYNREERDGGGTGYADLGLTFLLNPNFQLDARVGQGFNGDGDYTYGFGLVYRI